VPVTERILKYTEEPVPTNGNSCCRASQLVDAPSGALILGRDKQACRGCPVLFDTIFVISAAIIIARNLFTRQGKIGMSLLAIGLSALLTASLTPYYVSFIRLPNQGLATVAYYIVTYLLLYVLIAVPAIILSSIIKIAVTGLLLGLMTHLLPVSIATGLVGESRVYPLMAPLFARLPPLDVQALGSWLRHLLPGNP
jgi:hypothetical protein